MRVRYGDALYGAVWCPFCESIECALTKTKAVDENGVELEEEIWLHYVACHRCGATGPITKKASDAVEAWRRVGGEMCEQQH